MIYELKQSQFTKASHLLKGEFINLEIKAVVEGFNPGWVFVDDVEDPKTAMVWSKGIMGFYFVGEEDNPQFNDCIDDYIDKEITPRAKALGMDWFEFSGTSQKWNERLEAIFSNRQVNKSKQFVYGHKSVDGFSSNHTNLVDGYRLKRVDESLLKSDQYNLEFVESAILEWWNTIDDYLEKGAGFCILHKQTAVCSCVTSFMTGSEMESHIQTIEDHRKKGLATIAVRAFVEYCRDHDYEPYWDCMEKNYGSRALAEKFGYSKMFDYALYEFKLD